MSEKPKTLQQIGYESARHYDNHRMAAKVKAREHRNVADEKEVIANFKAHPESVPYQGFVEEKEEALEGFTEEAAKADRVYDATIERGARHYRQNEEQLHDLAVIEAHLGGVAINVEQPITVGQQVPVRVERPSEH